MTQEITTKIQRLESTLDLDLLVQGDIVKIQYRYLPLSDNNFEEEIAAYYTKNELGYLEFIVPVSFGERNYLILYKSRKSSIELNNGEITLIEDKSLTKSYNFQNPEYEILNQILIKTGLRRE